MSQTIINNFIQHENYIEPFGGGASVLFAKTPSIKEIYNDINKNVYSLFKVISDANLFEAMRFKLEISPYSKDLSKEFKEDLNKDLTIEDRAYKYFYVNRTSFNGTGMFSVNLDIRKHMSKSVRDYLSAIEGLEEIHNRLRTVIIENSDAIVLIKKYDLPNTLMYLDPPYHWNTRTSIRYEDDMNDEKQIEFIETLKEIKNAHILLSGYSCELYDTLLDHGFNKEIYEIKTVDGDSSSKIKFETLYKNYKQDEQRTFNF